MNEPKHPERPSSPDAVDSLASWIAHAAPSLSELSSEQLESIAQIVIKQRLARDLEHRAVLAGISITEEIDMFIRQAGRSDSSFTRKAYEHSLRRLREYAEKKNLPLLFLTPKDADNYIYALKEEGRAPSSILLDVSAASSFFSFLERRYDGVVNPFRGTKARPARRTVGRGVYPGDEEVTVLFNALPPRGRAILSWLAFRGLRIGALPPLFIQGERFTTVSKGKEFSGTVPPICRQTMEEASLNPYHPFARFSPPKLADQIRYFSKQLMEKNLIAAMYSAHDFRHYFAMKEYRKDFDLYRLSRLLAHDSIKTTEIYLKGIGEID